MLTLELDAKLKPVPPMRRGKPDNLIWAMAKTNKLDTKRVVHSTFGEADEFHSNYFSYLYRCWSEHRTPILTPDIIWFTLLHELTDLVRENADKVRHLFTTSTEKQMIVVTTGTPYILPVDVVVAHLQKLVPSGVDTYLPEFTTTTPQARLAHCAAFCDMVSPYYGYGTTMCGFPSIRIEGSIEDWIKVAETWFTLPQDLKSLDMGWFDQVQKLLFDIGRGYHQQSVEFWQRMFFIKNCGSGHSSDVHGWFRKLYRKQPRHISPDDFPVTAAKVDYTFIDSGQTFTMFQGLFSSKLDGNVLTPDWNTLVFETTTS